MSEGKIRAISVTVVLLVCAFLFTHCPMLISP